MTISQVTYASGMINVIRENSPKIIAECADLHKYVEPTGHAIGEFVQVITLFSQIPSRSTRTIRGYTTLPKGQCMLIRLAQKKTQLFTGDDQKIGAFRKTYNEILASQESKLTEYLQIPQPKGVNWSDVKFNFSLVKDGVRVDGYISNINL